MIDLKISFVSSLPLHRQVHDKVLMAIQSGSFDAGSRLPSIKDLSKGFNVSAITVERAYRQLLKDKVLYYSKGKGYFVLAGPDSRLKILLIFNKLSSYKRKIYYSLLNTLGDQAKVDLQVHHYDPGILSEIVSQNLGKYNYYVIMPHFYNDAAREEYLAPILSIPRNELVLLDKGIPELGDDFISVHQDFENDIYDALVSGMQLLEKYERVTVLFPPESHHPAEILKGIDRFCKWSGKELSIWENILDGQLIKGAVYIVTSETDLAELVKSARTLNFKLGKDIGIISFNETALKELLDITVITTDWRMMGETAGKLILAGNRVQKKNAFRLIPRASL